MLLLWISGPEGMYLPIVRHLSVLFLTNRVYRLNVHVDENDVIQNATCG